MNQASNRNIAVVTGAAGGVGKAYSLGLARRGYDLLLVGRTQATLQALADEINAATGRTVEIAALDLADAAQLATLVQRLATDTAITLLANLAGVAQFSPFTQISGGKIAQTIAVNITAFTQLCHAVAPRFAATGAGTIVNFASVLAFRPWAEFNVYNASKAYVVALSQSLQAELQEKGVLVQVVAPPATATPFWLQAGFSHENLPAKAVMKADDLVAAALIGLDKGEQWVLPSLADSAVWDAFQDSRVNLVKGMMNGTIAERYTAA
jgi:short-subunit dehydrogenase